MHFRFKGYGIWVIFIVFGVLIVLRPLIERFSSGSADALRRHINGAVFAISGALTFWIASVGDKKTGIDVFSKQAWTSDLMTSTHISFNIPMRLVGVLLFLFSLFF